MTAMPTPAVLAYQLAEATMRATELHGRHGLEAVMENVMWGLKDLGGSSAGVSNFTEDEAEYCSVVDRLIA